MRHRRHSHGRARRARTRLPRDGLHLHLDDARLLPDCLLGVERQRLGLQVGRSRLCWCVRVATVAAPWLSSFRRMLTIAIGGGPVEIGSGISGLAYSWALGRRSERELRNFRPHNVSLVGLGTFILWFGWLGFNGGSAFGANLRAIMAIWNSMIAAAMSGIVWCLLDYRIERKWSMVGFCSGTIAGLVAATPASGYIPQWAAFVMGIIVGAVSNYGTKRTSGSWLVGDVRLTTCIQSSSCSGLTMLSVRPY